MTRRRDKKMYVAGKDENDVGKLKLAAIAAPFFSSWRAGR